MSDYDLEAVFLPTSRSVGGARNVTSSSGWTCPGCRRNFAPHVSMCLYCQPGVKWFPRVGPAEWPNSSTTTTAVTNYTIHKDGTVEDHKVAPTWTYPNDIDTPLSGGGWRPVPKCKCGLTAFHSGHAAGCDAVSVGGWDGDV